MSDRCDRQDDVRKFRFEPQTTIPVLIAPILGAICVVIEAYVHNSSDTPTKAAIRGYYLSFEKPLGLGLLIAAAVVALVLAYSHEHPSFLGTAIKIWVCVQLVLFCLFSVVFIAVLNLLTTGTLTVL